VNFRGATISGVFTADGAFVTNPGDKTIALRRARIGGDLRLSGGFWSIGLMVFNRAVIDGRLRADDATFTWRPAESPLDPPGEANLLGCAVEGISAEVKGGMRLGWTLHGALDLSGATTAFIEDRPDQDWPADSHLGGLAYSRFNNGWDAPTRTAWLSRLGRYDPRAWEQLAAVLRTAGDRDGAEQVLIAQRRHARRIGAVPPRRRLFDLLQDVTVRYGFRPQRAVYLLLALVVAVTVTLSLPAARSGMRATDQNAAVFTPAGPVAAADPARCGNGRVRCLKPFFYAVDTVVPLIDLHQRSTWYPTSEHGGTWLEWWLNLCTILGWATSTVFALSLTRLARAA
jgi:hypothetical protein